MRYAACVEYDGSKFNGWQVQKHQARTVQAEVERALTKVANHPVEIVTAGRTDSRVHATHQVIHFDSSAQRDTQDWLRGTNRFMDLDVRLNWVHPVSDEFHARFSATSRSYRFIIYNHAIAPAIARQYLTHEYRELDIGLMREAGVKLRGEHDFSSFRAAGCQAHSPVRCITHFEVHKAGPFIWFDVTANAFLQHMVRNIAGTLIEVGYGKRTIEEFSHLLEAKDRTQAGITAEPFGLYLVGVTYDAEFALPSEMKPIEFWGGSGA